MRGRERIQIYENSLRLLRYCLNVFILCRKNKENENFQKINRNYKNENCVRDRRTEWEKCINSGWDCWR